MTERVLSTRALNRALLARQLLLERSEFPIPRGLERVAGIQSQYAPSAYIGLWTRLDDFRREALTTALVRRRAVQATLMRATIHIVSARDYWLFAAPVRRSRREWWLRVQAKPLRGVDMEAAAARVREFLSEDPRRYEEIMQHLAAAGFPRIAGESAGMWVDLVRVPPSGTWEHRRADLYGLADRWLRPSNPERGGGARAPRASVPGRVRPRLDRRRRELGRALGRHAPSRHRPVATAHVRG